MKRLSITQSINNEKKKTRNRIRFKNTDSVRSAHCLHIIWHFLGKISKIKWFLLLIVWNLNEAHVKRWFARIWILIFMNENWKCFNESSTNSVFIEKGQRKITGLTELASDDSHFGNRELNNQSLTTILYKKMKKTKKLKKSEKKMKKRGTNWKRRWKKWEKKSRSNYKSIITFVVLS